MGKLECLDCGFSRADCIHEFRRDRRFESKALGYVSPAAFSCEECGYVKTDPDPNT